MAINYTSITDAQKLEVSDLLSKIEAIEDALATVQTERATSEVGYSEREEVLRAEKNVLLAAVRAIRSASVV